MKIFSWFLILVFLAAPKVWSEGAPYKQGSVEQLFPNEPKPIEKVYKIEDRSIYYYEVESQKPKRILFIHGSPGGWEAYGDYLKDPQLASVASLISVDRPGFGKSDPGRVVWKMSDHSRLLAPLLKTSDAKIKTLIVGHSLGGPIAAQLAMDFPDLVSGLVLVAPSIDPNTEQPRWYNYLLSFIPVQFLIPQNFVWSNRELMSLDDELKIQDKRWKNLKIPVTVIQGMKDELVLPSTADYAESVLTKPLGKVVRVLDQGHFVLWKRPDLVVNEILEILKK